MGGPLCSHVYHTCITRVCVWLTRVCVYACGSHICLAVSGTTIVWTQITTAHSAPPAAPPSRRPSLTAPPDGAAPAAPTPNKKPPKPLWPTPRAHHLAVAYHSSSNAPKLLILGGVSKPNTYVKDNQLSYDVATRRWEVCKLTGKGPGAFSHGSVAVVGGAAVVFGGRNEGGPSGAVYSLQLEGGVWAQVKTSGCVPSQRFGHVSVGVKIPGGVMMGNESVASLPSVASVASAGGEEGEAVQPVPVKAAGAKAAWAANEDGSEQVRKQSRRRRERGRERRTGRRLPHINPHYPTSIRGALCPLACAIPLLTRVHVTHRGLSSWEVGEMATWRGFGCSIGRACSL